MKIKSLLIFLLLFLLIGCGKEAKKNLEKNYEVIDLVLDWYPTASSSPIYMALEKGYYEEEGIKLNIHMPSGASDPLALVASKKVDLGYYYMQGTIMSVVNENIPVKVLGAILQSSVTTVMSLKEKNIKRPKDLEGKILGYVGGPLSEKIIEEMMKADGGDLSKVKLVDVGFDLLTSIVTKKVDAVMGGLVTHEIPLLEEKGYLLDYFFPRDFGVPDYPETLIIANKELIVENNRSYYKFLKATKRGFEDVKKDPEEALKILLKNQAKDQFPLNENVERIAINKYILIMEKFGPFLTISDKMWNENIDWLYEKGFIKRKEKIKNLQQDLINSKKKLIKQI